MWDPCGKAAPDAGQALQRPQCFQAALALVAQQVWLQALQSILVQHAHCAVPPDQKNALLQANSAFGSRRWKEETHVAAELFCLPGLRDVPSLTALPSPTLQHAQPVPVGERRCR